LRLKKRKGAKILRKERKDLLFFDAICHTPHESDFVIEDYVIFK